MTQSPQLYLVTPGQFDLSDFPARLAGLLDAGLVACVRLDLPGADEDMLRRSADALRDLCHTRDVPLVLADHYRLAANLGLDGVHLRGLRDIRNARDELGKDGIIGAFCEASRHDGLTAGDAGADYVAFGPVTPTALGSGDVAGADLFEWWAQMIEVPVVAEGGLTDDALRSLAPFADFVALGAEVWSADDPAARLAEIAALVSDGAG